MAMAQTYLAVYNVAQACGWCLLLLRLPHKSSKSIQLACFLQFAAFLEVLHSLIGLVRSATMTTFLQWGGRFHVITAIALQVEEVQGSPFLTMMLAAWSLSEVIRYPQYVTNILGACPGWLTWLRYTAFIVLYPIGIVAEMGLMYLALPFIKKQDLYGSFFNWIPFINYYQFIMGLLIAYPFIASVLYKHMLSQRRAKLSKKQN